MSDISVNTFGSTVYLSGYSGTDYSSLIEAQYEAYLTDADTMEAEVEEAELELAAYQDLYSYVGDMQSSLEAMTDDGTYGSTSVFDEKTGYLTSSDSSVTASDVFGVSVDPEAETGSYDIEVDQLATAHKIASDETVASDSTADLGLSGTFTLSSAGGTATDITVDAGMSLEEIKDEINNYADDTGVGATILQVSDTENMLILTATDTNQEISITDTDGVMESLGMVDSGGAAATELQAAQPAMLTVDGVSVERDDNDIDDLLEGVTFSLYDAEPGTNITLDIEQDYASITSAIESFVEAYNTYRDFVVTHQSTAEDGGAADDAVLFGDSTLRTVNNQVYDYLTQTVEADDGVSVSMNVLGLSFDDDNYLELDSSALEDVMLTDMDYVESFFGFNKNTDSTDLQVMKHDGVYSNLDFTMNIAVDGGGDITSADIDGDSSALTFSGSTLTGAEGSAYEGLSFTYSGGTDQSINVSITQGIADQMSYLLDLWTDSEDGILTDRITDLESQIDDKQDEIDDEYSAADDYLEDLISYYADLEASIVEAQTQKDTLEALTSSD